MIVPRSFSAELPRHQGKRVIRSLISLILNRENGILSISIDILISGEVEWMTVQQEACRMIDRLSDDAVLALIHIMECMMPEKGKEPTGVSKGMPTETKKRTAYLRLKELRSELKLYAFSEADRAEGLEEKYGTY